MAKITTGAVAALFSFGMAGAANAQAPVVVPGAGNSTQITNSNREQNAGYNHVVSNMDPVKPGEQPKSGLKGKAVPAVAADIRAGSQLRDSKGVPIGMVQSVDADGVVVDTGQTKIKVPLVAFGKDDAGLLLGITAAKFSELVAGAKSSKPQ
jgi:hypothetical protein